MSQEQDFPSDRDPRGEDEDPHGQDAAPHPARIGRYQILRKIGSGGFGEVFLGFDDDLDRPVAIKVPRAERISSPADLEAYMNEARIVASLDHRHIVPVYDVGRTEDGSCFVVSRFIEGPDLATRIGERRPGFPESARLIAAIADALHHAHLKGLVHRDVKPSNILLDDAGTPFLTDFGLALKEEDYGTGATMGGTPAYMSPEQARGEGHRVEGRSDIFSLGVVFYELLTGRRPFVSRATCRTDALVEILELIIHTEPRPPRQIDDTIPPGLERICLKAMSKRACERFNTAKDMAADLRAFLERADQGAESTLRADLLAAVSEHLHQPATTHADAEIGDAPAIATKVVPKGLRCFDEQDADFFLELLPGPRDRHGMPEGLRFWKARLESLDPDRACSVGVIYGPSGCGKSSMVRAGLLPRLAGHVLSVYTEASQRGTETRLLNAIRRACPGLPDEASLVEVLTALRRGQYLPPGRKVVLILDQFEQWLHARTGDEGQELIGALRQCDGSNLAAVLLVRDDFWLAVSRFMAALEIDLVTGRNLTLVDLFSPRHAREVLGHFAEANGALPGKVEDRTRDQNAFLDLAIAELSRDGKIVPVRLALFFEMVKDRTWSPSTLRELGGIEGVGVRFLEETFSSPQSNHRHRHHQQAAQRILRTLLPRGGLEIKGQVRSLQELREAAGYTDRPREFTELLGMLVNELRLISPIDPERPPADGQDTSPEGPCYELTHDYLVRPVREWISRKQRETARGRAAWRLQEYASLWNAKPENRLLPSPLAWAEIRLLTRTRDWTQPQAELMKRARRVYGIRGLAYLILLGAVGLGVTLETHRRQRAEALSRANDLLSQLLDAPPGRISRILDEIEGVRPQIQAKLREAVARESDLSSRKLHASLALLPIDPSQSDYLFGRLIRSSPSELPLLRKALASRAREITPQLWAELEDARPGDPRLLASAAALSRYDPESPRWNQSSSKLGRALGSVNSALLAIWIDLLKPVREVLKSPLATIVRDPKATESERNQATNILSNFAADDLPFVADLLLDADAPSFATLLPIAVAEADEAARIFRSELDLPPSTIAGPDREATRDRLAERQARAAIGLMRLGRPEAVWQGLCFRPDPRLRSVLINELSAMGADPGPIAAHLIQLDATARTSPPIRPGPGQGPMEAVLFHEQTSQRRALILALGNYPLETFSTSDRRSLIAEMLDLYRDDPDAGIHGAAESSLRRWGQDEKRQAIDPDLVRLGVRAPRRWFLDRTGLPFAIVEPVEFLMGSPPTEPDRESDERQHRRLIPRRFAIAMREVSMDQVRRFLEANPKIGTFQKDKYCFLMDGPSNGLTWYDAAALCNWMSDREGYVRCFTPDSEGRFSEGMTLTSDVLKRGGYRLPTEAEWEYAGRAGAITSRPYGHGHRLLGRYARYQGSSQSRAWPCGSLLPNELGLVDTLGNVQEWCLTREQPYASDVEGPVRDDLTEPEVVKGLEPRVTRGGALNSPAWDARNATRFGSPPGTKSYFIGIRLARTLP